MVNRSAIIDDLIWSVYMISHPLHKEIGTVLKEICSGRKDVQLLLDKVCDDGSNQNIPLFLNSDEEKFD